MSTRNSSVGQDRPSSAGLAAVAAVVVMIGLVGCNQVTWNKTFGGTAGEMGCSVQQTADGGYVLGGAFTDGCWDVLLVKTDADGNELWSKHLGQVAEDEYGECVREIPDKGFIIAGHVGLSAPDVDGLAIRTDPTGNELWSKAYGGDDEDEFFSVELTIGGGFIFAGATKAPGADHADAWLLKTDMDGNELWTKTYGGTSRELFNSVRQTSDGGFIMAGDTSSSGPFSNNGWLVKTDANGNWLWDQVFGGDDLDFARSAEETADGGFIVAGQTQSFGAGYRDGWLIKTDADGNELWSQTFGSTEADSIESVHETSLGGYILAGKTRSFGSGDNDLWLIKTDASGLEVWQRRFGGAMGDIALAVQETADLGFIVAGQTHTYGAGASDAWLIKTDSFGNAPLTP